MNRISISGRTLWVLSTALGVMALGLGVAYLRSPDSFARKYRLRMYVPEASTLVVGAPVDLDGIQVGRVEQINLALASPNANPDRRVELILNILERYHSEIRTDSLATLNIDGLLGPRFVSINRGFGGTVISSGGEIPSRAPALPQARLNDVISAIANAANRTEKEK